MTTEMSTTFDNRNITHAYDFKNKNDFNVLLSNARSLENKLECLVETMEELNTQVAVVTETWFDNSNRLQQKLTDLRDSRGFGTLHKPRCETGALSRGGGVAIVYDSRQIELQKICTKASKFETVAAIGRRSGQRRKILIIGAYIPPSYDAALNNEVLEHISDMIRSFKIKYNAPYFVVAGDFNHRRIEEELREFRDIKLVKTAPTRGRNCLDLIFTNYEQYIKEAGVTDPFFGEVGNESDHKTVFAHARIPRVPEYTIQKYTYLKRSPEGDQKLLDKIKDQNWTTLMTKSCPTDIVQGLHLLVETWKEECYERKTMKKKSSQPQWMTPAIEKLIQRRRAIFRKFGRNVVWKKMKRRTVKIIKKRRAYYNKLKKDKLMSASSKDFHACVRAFVSDEKTKEFDVRRIVGEEDPKRAAEACAAFFNGISSEYQKCPKASIPSTYDEALPAVTPEQVVSEFQKGKKPRSMVPGDLYIDILGKTIGVLAPMIARIYNLIVATGTWPDPWLTEYVTVIPKKGIPESLGDCRNISCTNFLSKLFERFVLRWARQQVTPKPNQYGGERGCATDHFLVEIWDKVTDHLEDSRACSVLTAIDYSKAFNRLEHGACLRSFSELGASSQVLQLLGSFLLGRKMTVKVNQQYSSPRDVNAGAPQGSVLGTYVFNIGTDRLEEGLDLPPPQNQDHMHEIGPGDLSFLETVSQESYAESTPRRVRFPLVVDISPVRGEQRLVELQPTIRNIPDRIRRRIEPTWRPKMITVDKFVDDNLETEKLLMKSSQTYQDAEGKLFKNERAIQSEALFNHITSQATKQGLLVNEKKTTMLAISSAVSYEARSHLYDKSGNRVESGNGLRVLGFEFNKHADVSSQIESLSKRFRSRIWALRNLRRSNFSEDELKKVYTSTIRPVLEYSSVVYHSMMTSKQSDSLEALQSRALKNIYGNSYSYRRLLEISGLPTLAQRRLEACRKFAKKTSDNARFKRWFPTRRTTQRRGGGTPSSLSSMHALNAEGTRRFSSSEDSLMKAENTTENNCRFRPGSKGRRLE